MDGYSAAPWGDFFIAQVGATAALTGLLFVAVSINLDKILAYPSLPRRAGDTLTVLADVLVATSLGLVPGQSSELLGAEILVVALGAWLLAMRTRLRRQTAVDPAEGRGHRWGPVIGIQLALVPFMVAGVSLIVCWGGGLYWLVPGVVLSLFVALVNAWVLLVEIQR